MARLLSPPLVDLIGWEPLSGPRSVGAGASQSIGNFLQTFSSPFGLWRMRFLFPPFEGQEARRFRGWVSAMHGGANATRWSFFDPDQMSFQEAGVDATDMAIRAGQPWSNGQGWSNGMNWATSRPPVPISAPTALDGTIVNLSDSYWGHRAGVGDFIGFFPFYFGMHVVTEVITPGEYRVWPPLRKSVAASDFATLSPVLAMKMESEEAAPMSRGGVFMEGSSITLVETLDYDARDYFAD